MNFEKSETRKKIIKPHISQTEYAVISEQRQASGLSESEFVRRAFLGVKLSGSGSNNQKAMAHLCDLQTLLN